MINKQNKIEKLITELCPNGVDFLAIGDVAEIGTGSGNTIDAVENGDYPFYIRSKDVKRSDKYIYDEAAIVIPGEGGVGDIFHFVKGKYNLHQRAYRIHFTNKNVNPKFAYFYFLTSFKKFILQKAVGATVISIRKPMIEKFKIPVLPILIQKEIVKILDKFAELEVELEVELEARKKQYEYYQSNLLTFDNQVEWLTLKNIGRRNSGTNITAGRMRELHQSNAPIRIFAGGSTVADVQYNAIPEKDIIREPSIIVKSRGYIGFEYYEKPFSHKNEFWSYTINDKNINQKFVYYYLLTQIDKFQKKAKTTSVKIPQLSVSDTDNFKIPIPKLSEQNRIVSILDKFNSLVNDISIGLPAELAARRKQYEYYRNKLLTFNEYVGK